MWSFSDLPTIRVNQSVLSVYRIERMCEISERVETNKDPGVRLLTHACLKVYKVDKNTIETHIPLHL